MKKLKIITPSVNQCPLFESVCEHIETNGGNISEEIATHIKSCPSCREYYEFWQEFELFIEASPKETDEDVISEWEKQISIQKVRHQIHHRAKQKKIIVWGLLTAVAGIVFLILALFYFIPSTQAPSVQAIEQPSIIEKPSSDYSGNSIPYNTTPEKRLPDKDM
ncbi:MAG TPA: hypothetical protein PLT82_05690 [Candidatus Hydrogenedens sp.]|nr:hypothetical protein [Candidatus Hydrogenedens sp.]HOL19815.1 hypothetical protein [Candidatus Hydrogenedens sp.]HPP58606.1 hypothetical protein [Candidatus Hydrogenedens sp.]